MISVKDGLAQDGGPAGRLPQGAPRRTIDKPIATEQFATDISGSSPQDAHRRGLSDLILLHFLFLILAWKVLI
ncbi:hypothetical protein ACTZWT_09355 [Rhodopseudomonas sp. NSM]|uniref:hypothetical protein n=1 Tax=Rhodopseudomonas sp. NSM TaxID=3457630 RepID=UPI004036D6E5